MKLFLNFEKSKGGKFLSLYWAFDKKEVLVIKGLFIFNLFGFFGLDAKGIKIQSVNSIFIRNPFNYNFLPLIIF